MLLAGEGREGGGDAWRPPRLVVIEVFGRVAMIVAMCRTLNFTHIYSWKPPSRSHGLYHFALMGLASPG